MNELKNINYVNEYYKKIFGERTLKICIDGQFTCPNRDGRKGTGGCIFCSERGSGEHLNPIISISDQITKYFASYRAKRANKFILYFQNYTNTYDTIEILKNKYETALNTAIEEAKKQEKSIVGLDIATRPDCIDENICELISSYKEYKGNALKIFVELGLQTANDEIGEIINRCYKTQDFINAVNLLRKYDIEIIVHVMVGLPKQTHEDIKETIDLINSLDIQGIKVHSTYIVKNTKLAQMYKDNEYEPLTLEEYLEELKYIINHIKKDVVFHRISGDAPKDLLLAPEWNLHKKNILNKINKLFL